LLLEKGADPNAVETRYHETALHKAVRVCASAYSRPADTAALLEMLRLIIDHGADINAYNENASTPLDYANKSEIYDFLVQRGATHGQCNQALHEALSYQDQTAVTWLLQRDIGCNSADRHGLTPLMIAAINNNLPGLQQLLSSNADLTATCGDGGTVLHAACRAGSFECIRHLLDHTSIDINHQNAAGETALCLLLSYQKQDYVHAAIVQARKDADAMAEYMVLKGASLEIVDEDGDTPLAFAQTKKLRIQLSKVAQARAIG
jgi:ankyrin repeat protein